MIKIQKLAKKKVGSFAVDCNFNKVDFIGLPSYYEYMSEDISKILNEKIEDLGFKGKIIALTYSSISVGSGNIDNIKIIIDGDITISNTKEYFNTDNGIKECRLDIRYNKVFPSQTINATVNVEVYEYSDLEQYTQYLSGEFEIDDNTVPRPKEIYHDFGISDGQIKLDSSSKNQGFTSNSEDLYVIISRDRLYAVMGIKRTNEIVNDKLEKVIFTDQSNTLYEGEIIADIYNSELPAFYLQVFNNEILQGRKMCNSITYSKRINDSLSKTLVRYGDTKGIFLEELDMREYVSLICEIYDSTVSIDNGALRFMAR